MAEIGLTPSNSHYDPPSTDDSHSVQQGESLSLISKKYNIPIQKLIDANPQIKNPGTIYPGQQITIPLTSDATGNATLSANKSATTNATNSQQHAPSATGTNASSALLHLGSTKEFDSLAKDSASDSAINNNTDSIAARKSLEDTNFIPKRPENFASLDFQVFIFGDYYTRHPINQEKIDTPYSALYTFVDKNIGTLGNPDSSSAVPVFVTIPVNPNGLSVGSTITGDTPGVFAVITPPWGPIPKPFAVAYADADYNVGAIGGIWSVIPLPHNLGLTIGARVHASANISGFIDGLDSTPQDLEALAPGGPVEKTYLQLQGYDQHGTLNAMGINSLKDYKDVISSYAQDGGYNLPVKISDVAFKQTLSAEAVNRQVALHLVEKISIVNDVDLSQTAGQAQLKLDQVNQRIEVVTIELETLEGNTNPEVLGDVAYYESELIDLKAQGQALDKFINDLPDRFSHDVYSPEKVWDGLTNHAHSEKQVIINLEENINAAQQQLEDAKLKLGQTMFTGEMEILEQKIPELETLIDVLQEQKAAISSSWRPDISSEAYATTQALKATNDKIDANEKKLVNLSKGLSGMPATDLERQTISETKTNLLTDLNTLYNDKEKLEEWLHSNAPTSVTRQEGLSNNTASPPKPTFKPLDASPTHQPSPPRPDISNQDGLDISPTHLPSPPRSQGMDQTVVDTSSQSATSYGQALANDIRSWGQGFMDLGGAVKSHFESQMNQPKDHYSILEKRDFEKFGQPGESLDDYTQRTKR